MFKRRRIMTLFAATALSASLVACGSESATDSGSSGSSDSTTTERLENLVMLAGSSTAQQLDPHKYKNVADMQYISMVYDGLFHFTEGGKASPQLAESGEFSEDGTTYTIKLKPNATFQDGSPIDAEAVKASLERAKTLEGSTVVERMALITAIEVVSPTEVKLSVSDRARHLPDVLAGPEGRIVKVVDGDIALDPGAAASGPYKLVEFEPGGRAVFDLIENYWDTEFQGAKHIEVSPTADASTRLTVLTAGDGDAGSVGGFSVDAVAEQVESGALDLQLEYFEHPTHVFIQFNRNTGPFADVRVRQALAHALDLSEAPKAIFGSTARPADAVAPDLDVERPFDYDQAKAKSLLADAGLADGFSFEIGCFDGDFCKLGEAFQAKLAEVGIDMKVTMMPPADLRGRMAESTLDAALEGVSPLPTTTQRMQAMFFSPGQRTAELGDRADEARELFQNTLDQTLTDEEFTEAVEAFNAFVWEENTWYIPVIWYNNATLARAGLGNVARLYDSGMINARVLTAG